MKTPLQTLIDEIDAKLDECTNVDQIATATFIRDRAKQLLEVEKEVINENKLTFSGLAKWLNPKLNRITKF